MKRFLILTFTCLIIAGFGMFLPGTAKASGAPANVLFGVATAGMDDGWAVGETPTSTGSQPLIEHLEENTWSVVSSPVLSGATFSGLQGVAAVSENDVWAVGSSSVQTLVEHWNGNQWQVVSSPTPAGSGAFLNAVSAVSKGDVWAVGVNNINGGQTTLIEHWNGQSWQIVPSPNAGSRFAFLSGVTARSKNDVWAVGNFIDSNYALQALIEHWNGSAWVVVSNPAPSQSVLEAVVSISHKDVWAVGHFFDGNKLEALTEHWNGQVWQVVTTPNPVNAMLTSVTAVSHKDVWAVGDISGQNGSSISLIEHWNGQTWQIVSSPNPTGSSSSQLLSVTARSHKDVWAVGNSYANGTTTTLTEHWNGQSWSIVSSPTP